MIQNITQKSAQVLTRNLKAHRNNGSLEITVSVPFLTREVVILFSWDNSCYLNNTFSLYLEKINIFLNGEKIIRKGNWCSRFLDVLKININEVNNFM